MNECASASVRPELSEVEALRARVAELTEELHDERSLLNGLARQYDDLKTKFEAMESDTVGLVEAPVKYPTRIQAKVLCAVTSSPENGSAISYRARMSTTATCNRLRQLAERGFVIAEGSDDDAGGKTYRLPPEPVAFESRPILADATNQKDLP